MTDIFVFGSNLAGRHGAGAALHAKLHYGAINGQGAGLQGNSYAIPTKDGQLRPLSLKQIEISVKQFVSYVLVNNVRFKDRKYIVTAVGCGLAGYEPHQIAPMFYLLLNTENVKLPQVFLDEYSIDKTRGTTPTERKIILEGNISLMYSQGYSQTEIANTLNTSHTKVCLLVKKFK